MCVHAPDFSITNMVSFWTLGQNGASLYVQLYPEEGSNGAYLPANSTAFGSWYPTEVYPILQVISCPCKIQKLFFSRTLEVPPQPDDMPFIPRNQLIALSIV